MKGNMFLGMARGSVGDVTFARVKGQQVGRARNRRPNNPRTQSQMTQRSSFMSAVKFFAKGRQNYFTFAFEGKKANESDYNAFMRLNSKKGYQMTKEIYDNPNYPAVGEWQLSQGSLKDIATVWESDSLKFMAMLGIKSTMSSAAITVGEVSQKLIATGEYMAGDILTFGEIRTESVVEEGSDPMPIAWSEDGIQWVLSQFILNPSSSQLMSEALPELDVTVLSNNNEVVIWTNDSLVENQIGGFFATHSRKTLNGLKVSNTYMRNNDAALRAIELSRTDAYNAWVLAEWQARELAILEGALSNAADEGGGDESLILTAELPIYVSDESPIALGTMEPNTNVDVNKFNLNGLTSGGVRLTISEWLDESPDMTGTVKAGEDTVAYLGYNKDTGAVNITGAGDVPFFVSDVSYN